MAVRALHDGKMFQRLSATRDRCLSSAFVLSFYSFQHPGSAVQARVCESDSEQQIFLGFVLPKRLVKRAVDRNQIKRWIRALLRTQTVSQPCAVVIKARAKVFLGASDARDRARDELAGLVKDWGTRVPQISGSGNALNT